MSLLILGTMAFDSIETPFGKAEKVIGGAATYSSWAALHFTPDVKLLSVIGEDFPNEELAALKERGVDAEGVERREGEKSFFWHGRYKMDMNSRDTLATELNVLADYQPKVPASYQNSEYLLLGNFDPDIQLQVLEQMEYRPKLIAMDTMNFWMDSKLDVLKEVIRKIDIIIINDEEARQLSGQNSLVKAAKVIREMGPDYVIIKKGEHGALLFHYDEVFAVPALLLEEVFDPTGAGDSFAGGFMGYMARTHDFSFEGMKRAVVYGSVLASFCVEKFGTEQLKAISNKDINARALEFLSLTDFKVIKLDEEA